ncbi:MAG: hypothetical protein ACJAQT_004652 [Akkermansiaceae bacterium]
MVHFLASEWSPGIVVIHSLEQVSDLGPLFVPTRKAIEPFAKKGIQSCFVGSRFLPREFNGFGLGTEGDILFHNTKVVRTGFVVK